MVLKLRNVGRYYFNTTIIVLIGIDMFLYRAVVLDLYINIVHIN